MHLPELDLQYSDCLTRKPRRYTVAYQVETPFDNIEGAQEYLALLAQAVDEARQNADADILGEGESKSRRLDALRLVVYKLEKLEQHIKLSRRLLNDLRSLRRLLLDERAVAAMAQATRKTGQERSISAATK